MTQVRESNVEGQPRRSANRKIRLAYYSRETSPSEDHSRAAATSLPRRSVSEPDR